MPAKKILSEILAYYQYKLENNLCTMEEIQSATRVLEENMEINGTIADFAKFYGVPDVYVRGVINRKMTDKPVRRVFYKFNKFVKLVPESWRRKMSTEKGK